MSKAHMQPPAGGAQGDSAFRSSRINRSTDAEDLIHTAHEALASLSILVGEGREDLRRCGLAFLLQYILDDLGAALEALIRDRAAGGAHV